MSLTPLHWLGFDNSGADYWQCQCGCGRLVEVKTDVVATSEITGCHHCDPAALPYLFRRARTPRPKPEPIAGAIYPRRRVSEAGIFEKGDDGSWVAVHRKVAADVLGRELQPGEAVVHLNGDHQDNRPENLALKVTVPILELVSIERQRRAA